MDEVDQEFLVTKTIQEMELEKIDNVNFVGIYLSSTDKVENILLNVNASFTTKFSPHVSSSRWCSFH